MTPPSYWVHSIDPDDSSFVRPALGSGRDADVVVIGAGFTGLWTAYSLLRADPSLRVVVLERVVADIGIDCGFHKGGAIYFAVNDGQWRRMQTHHADLARHGLGDDWTLLDADAASSIVHAAEMRGGLFTPHAATVNPARLAYGLAREVERLGGVIHERTAVRSIGHGSVRTEHASVTAEVVVLGTEAYTRTIEGRDRDMLPLFNTVIATEPIPDGVWASIGLTDRELFEYGANMLGYGQRTADGRIVWGGLSAGYKWRMGIPAPSDFNDRVARRLQRRLVELFPALHGIGMTHRWGGVLGVPRDLLPGVGFDHTTGLAWGGGYTGQGVAAANAAGRALADLIRGVDSELVHLPWVGHRSRPWEPEPRAWLGVHAALTAAHATDGLDRLRARRGR